MDEAKKSQASCEEPERLGSYLIQEQVQQSQDSRVELYLDGRFLADYRKDFNPGSTGPSSRRRLERAGAGSSQ